MGTLRCKSKINFSKSKGKMRKKRLTSALLDCDWKNTASLWRHLKKGKHNYAYNFYNYTIT